MKSKVALLGCETYDPDEVFLAVKRGVELLGGVSAFVKKGEKILLKPNLLSGNPPERCVTTHPAVFRAAGLLLKEAGASLSYGDSPGFGSMAAAARKAGLAAAAEELGVSQADFEGGRSVHHPQALQNKLLTLANGALSCDGIVSLPKFKTHGLMRFTGAVKNQFGCVPGILKAQYHVKLADAYQFGTMLVDINTFLRPRLYIMDGIAAMEGNGPGSGTPRKMNVLLISADPVALDAVACRLMNTKAGFLPTSLPGEKAGLGTYLTENIDIAGDGIERFIARDFDIVRRPPDMAGSGGLKSLIKNYVTSRPVINRAKCTGCGICIKSCPVGKEALTWAVPARGKKYPRHAYGRCIRCFCCQEMCPEGAITAESPLLGRLIFRT